MKISKVVIRGFKRFREETFDLGDHIIVAGPNNMGKTTLLQAIATWHLALTRWRELNDYQRHGGGYTKAPIARQAFYSVPLRAFDMLWHKRDQDSRGQIEIILRVNGIDTTVEIIKDSTEQAYVRPARDAKPGYLRNGDNFPVPVFVPAISGLGIEEPVYQQPKINQLLGQGKPGDVLRNLLVQANQNEDAWERLTASIHRMFGYRLLPPETSGPSIIVKYKESGDEEYDIASAGSGLQQVLMLLTFLNTRQGATLLIDEPDAHLHVILQDGIYNELREAARKTNSQLIIATHSEVVINAVGPKDICALLGKPKRLADDEKEALIFSLRALSNMDIMLAGQERKIIYAEGHTDMDILRAWAKALNHKAAGYLEQPFWKPDVFETRNEAKGIKAKEHFQSLRLVEENIRAVQIIDSDGNDIPDVQMYCDDRLMRLCWSRYEIESYLVHPVTLARFIAEVAGEENAMADMETLKNLMCDMLPKSVVEEPLVNHDVLKAMKARTNILPPILEAAGLAGFPYTRYHEIAEMMKPEEIHPEVIEKLDAIADHLEL